MTAQSAKPGAKSTVRPHLFAADTDLPPDQNGVRVCRDCHLLGVPGDAHHTLPAGPDRDVQQLRAGEGGEG